MSPAYVDLGVYSDLPAAANYSHSCYPLAMPGPTTQRAVREMLSFNPWPARAQNARIDAQWECDGVRGQAISWSVGYGPRTEAWLLRPTKTHAPLPGVIALHDHGAFKYLGKEKIAQGPQPISDLQQGWMNQYYGGRPFANELARRGFAVLVPDVFTWGSRRFPLESIAASDRAMGEALHQQMPLRISPTQTLPDEVSRYCLAANVHEHTVQKYCHVLGTTMAGLVCFEDRVAVDYLLGRADVLGASQQRIGCIGLSGGGLRAGLLQATCDPIGAAVIVGMMSTYAGLLDHNVNNHTWMFFPSPTWAHAGDWPDVVSCRAPSPLLVQYDRGDSLFTLEGMQEADRRIADHYQAAGRRQNYAGEFYDGPHKFDLPMQESAFAWLQSRLTARTVVE